MLTILIERISGSWMNGYIQSWVENTKDKPGTFCCQQKARKLLKTSGLSQKDSEAFILKGSHCPKRRELRCQKEH